eukprot:GHRR01035432.1.p1 GENE.GHRR01035432.1~~GHRR01035432.1.p1  ORF type:complete len:158 (+),score=52.49 GHRR01035432.1:159-632(+)
MHWLERLLHGTTCMPQQAPACMFGTTDTSTEKVIQRIGKKFELVALEDSPFVRPASVLYELDGKRRRWDIIQAHSSVAVVLYHKDLDAFLVVRQFRPAVYAFKLREAQSVGQPAPDVAAESTIEPCAGLLDITKHVRLTTACVYLVLVGAYRSQEKP